MSDFIKVNWLKILSIISFTVVMPLVIYSYKADIYNVKENINDCKKTMFTKANKEDITELKNDVKDIKDKMLTKEDFKLFIQTLKANEK